MSVDIDLSINGVHVAMEARAIRHIGVLEVERDLIPATRLKVVFWNVNLVLVEHNSLARYDYIVNFQLRYALPLEVQKEVS